MSFVIIIALFLLSGVVFMLSQQLLRYMASAQRRLARTGVFLLLDLIPTPRSIPSEAARRGIAARMTIAGLSRAWTADRLYTAKLLFVIVYVPLMLFLATREFTMLFYVFYGILIFVVGWSWPELYTAQKISKRKRAITTSLPYILDLMQLQVQAGLNLESAIRGIAPTVREPWRQELKQIVFLVDRGMPFDRALREMAERIDLDDLHRFVLAIGQSGTLGTSLSETLAMQAEMLRTRRRQRAEERARTASVKIAIPLVFLIFPAMLIVYIAPALLRVMAIF